MLNSSSVNREIGVRSDCTEWRLPMTNDGVVTS